MSTLVVLKPIVKATSSPKHFCSSKTSYAATLTFYARCALAPLETRIAPWHLSTTRAAWIKWSKLSGIMCGTIECIRNSWKLSAARAAWIKWSKVPGIMCGTIECIRNSWQLSAARAACIKWSKVPGIMCGTIECHRNSWQLSAARAARIEWFTVSGVMRGIVRMLQRRTGKNADGAGTK